MFKNVFIENDIKTNPKISTILEKIKFDEIKYIDSINDVWGKVKKPYLQKRESLNLFLGNKKGQLVKEAPAAYGIGKEKHFYFIHAYNCIYECQYCYLQGYFNTPDIVLFINHQDIIKDMENTISNYPDAWFHAGEFSDSLALLNITDEYKEYYKFFQKNPKAKLELRTKAVNTKKLLELPPLPNIYVSFTISSQTNSRVFDTKCPSLKARLKAIKTLADNGFQLGIHLDPIIFTDNFKEEYKELCHLLKEIIPPKQLGYISIGVVRFTKNVYREVEKNYPQSLISKQEYVKSFDNKIRYNKPMRMWMMNFVKEQLIDTFDQDKIYFCMEE